MQSYSSDNRICEPEGRYPGRATSVRYHTSVLAEPICVAYYYWKNPLKYFLLFGVASVLYIHFDFLNSMKFRLGERPRNRIPDTPKQAGCIIASNKRIPRARFVSNGQTCH
ncbi:hypothetical protein CPC08DRAFT_462849 [Agrocybe pediades]|nr:hypothetical protein CPC08DRAFT_462849 [Agrocybe pediades]